MRPLKDLTLRFRSADEPGKRMKVTIRSCYSPESGYSTEFYRHGIFGIRFRNRVVNHGNETKFEDSHINAVHGYITDMERNGWIASFRQADNIRY